MSPRARDGCLTHGQPEEAERIVEEIEKADRGRSGAWSSLPAAEGSITIRPRGPIGFGELAGVMLRTYPGRTVLGLSLIISQAFLYNGVFFTFPLVLRNFYGVHRRSHRPLPAAVRPDAISSARCSLGRFFDTVGRKPMIVGDLYRLGGPARR